MARIVGNRIVPDEIITEQDTWRTNMNPQNAWGNYNTLPGNARLDEIEEFPLAHAGAAGPEYLDMGVDLSGVNLDDTGVYTRQKGEPWFAENRRNPIKNLINPDTNIFGYQRGPNDFNINNLGIMGAIKDQFEYRPATEEAWDSRTGTYLSAEEQDQQNALGGYYSNAARDARRTRARVLRMLARQREGKDINEERLKRFQDLGYGPEEVISQVTDVVQPGRGVTRDTSGWSSPGYTTRGGFTEPSRTTGTQHGGAGTRDVRGHHGNWAQGGRIGYQGGELVDENINVQGPGFDVNENIEMASDPNVRDSLNELSKSLFEGRAIHELTPEEYEILIDVAKSQAAAPGAEQGIASLV
jgi:hypothetical protein